MFCLHSVPGGRLNPEHPDRQFPYSDSSHPDRQFDTQNVKSCTIHTHVEQQQIINKQTNKQTNKHTVNTKARVFLLQIKHIMHIK